MGAKPDRSELAFAWRRTLSRRLCIGQAPGNGIAVSGKDVARLFKFPPRFSQELAKLCEEQATLPRLTAPSSAHPNTIRDTT
ncbi:hypothetical protein CHELA17_65511 [Chelatococcus asaccharovorans]|nr:hypothetical protein CHELA17_65511 [Chelatococcus asaccharovorans]